MSKSLDEQVQEQLSAVPDQDSIVGVFVSQEGALAKVIVADVVLTVKSAAVPLIAGDTVRLERRNGNLVLQGPVNARATTGRVTATGALTTVEYPNGSGVTAQLRRNSAYTPALNDLVLLDWSSGGVIVGKIDSNPTPPAPELPSTGGPQDFDVTFTALDSGSYQSGYGWRTNDVWSSASNTGGWFYGSKIRDTIPDTAVITGAWIYLPLQEQLGGAPFGRHGSDSKPGGALGFADVTTLQSRSGWVPIPAGLIDYLKANPGGLGFGFGGKNIWRGTQKDGSSGAVRVTYRA